MCMLAESGREYWRGVLDTGGFTAIPRWSRDPAPGVGEHREPIPGDLAEALRRHADASALTLSSLLLAAHATVLAALSGERQVATGYVPAVGNRPLPCRLGTDPATWRELLEHAQRAESQLLTYRDFPVDALADELGLTGPLFETVLDPAGDGGELAEHTVLWVGIDRYEGRLGLRLRYRTDVLDAEAAARIAGYHRTALALLAADPDAEHGQQTLLSAPELAFQLDGLAGPRRELPNCRFHELFEQRVTTHPHAVAAEHAGRQWTYGELNASANRLGRALLARGLGHEGVVAVVAERNLNWMAAVIAIFKAGGTYLPIEPHFPTDRIATMLSRAGCRLVLTEASSTATLEPALQSLPGVQALEFDTAYREGHADGDLGIPVAPDQLAYIYFTSGSTGEPKGAMCEHAGMLNHLYAKIEDLSIGEGNVVAQTAPQCFDISLWQLVSALLVGGRTLLVEQDVILDVQRFVAQLVAGRVGVLQVVPSYLEVVATYLEQRHCALPDLRVVSVTGEALKFELIQRWFGITEVALVNAYGLTETSDDTNHEVMHRTPDGGRVPLGPPVRNVHIYVVDENLMPVPLGAPGLIVFSGVCVGRGYVNDPERTRQVYLSDPHRPGLRLYRGGDYGRWLPDGKLEFLGRRDNQVKIRGFRIEIGEIENALLGVPGVRDGAVVVAERDDQSKHLVAYYSADRPISLELLQGMLGEKLPEYMVPSIFHWRESLPLTANSKIDTKALRALAAELAVGDDDEFQPPVTPTEVRLAAAFAKVLGVGQDEIGRQDHFFDLGGSSLSAVKLAIATGRVVSLKDVTRYPVLAELAALVDNRSEQPAELLQALYEPDIAQPSALVCFPYAGGNAVSFQPLAAALRGSGIAVYAVELPGHDVAATREPFAPMAQVVEQVVAEITRRGLTTVMLWGHSSGAAFAVATAAALQNRGAQVQRLFLAAQLPGEAAVRRTAAAELAGRSDAEIADRLIREGGHTGLVELDAQRASHVGAAYRHDCISAHHYLADTLDAPPAGKLAAPVTVVVAADDPSTAGFGSRHRDWQLVAEHVELYRLADGGHYFLRTRPAETAQAVQRIGQLLAS